jgi:hypothetical protein
MPTAHEGMMNQEIYTDLIKVLPPKIIIDVAEEIRAILHVADSEAETIIDPLIRSLAYSREYSRMVRWAQDTCSPPVRLVSAHNADEFFLLDSLAEKVSNQLHHHRMYVGDCLPYRCDEIMTDGSLILARIDSYEDFVHHADNPHERG